MEWHVQTWRNQQSAEGAYILSFRLDRFIDQTTHLISQEIVDRLIDKLKQSLETTLFHSIVFHSIWSTVVNSYSEVHFSNGGSFPAC